MKILLIILIALLSSCVSREVKPELTTRVGSCYQYSVGTYLVVGLYKDDSDGKVMAVIKNDHGNTQVVVVEYVQMDKEIDCTYYEDRLKYNTEEEKAGTPNVPESY